MTTQAFQQKLHEFFTVTFEAHRAEYLPLSTVPEIDYLDTSNQHVEGMTAFAYYFKEGDDLIYYSGDLGNVDTTLGFLAGRTEKNITVFHDVHRALDMKSHASYKDAQEKLQQYNVYGYHCAKETMPDDCKLKLVEDYPEFLC